MFVCQCERRAADPERFSSTTISTGSYVTTDPEQNWDHGEEHYQYFDDVLF